MAHGFKAAGLVESALLVGIVLAATAFGIVVAVLKDAQETRTGFGQLVIAGASVADFGTVILLSLFFSHQGSGIEATVALLVLFGALVAVIGLSIYRVHASGRLARTVERLRGTTAQIGVRIAMVVLVGLVFMAEEFGLEVVLGAFMAGAIVSLIDRDEAMKGSGEQEKLEAIGFGVFIPAFFVAAGIQLDLSALFDSTSSIVLVPAVVGALLIVRGVPALLYRPVLGDRARRGRPPASHLAAVHRRRGPDRGRAGQDRPCDSRRPSRGRRAVSAVVPCTGPGPAAVYPRGGTILTTRSSPSRRLPRPSVLFVST